MTRKHFIALAESLKYAHPGLTRLDDTPKARLVWRNAVDSVADSCAYFNGAFDRKRFLTACTPDCLGAMVPYGRKVVGSR